MNLKPPLGRLAITVAFIILIVPICLEASVKAIYRALREETVEFLRQWNREWTEWLHLFTVEEKIAAMSIVITEAARASRPPGSANQRHYDLLKAVCADLRGRLELPRNNSLGELDRALERMKASKTAVGYDRNRMIEVAKLVVNKWPTISQALEQYGEESVE